MQQKDRNRLLFLGLEYKCGSPHVLVAQERTSTFALFKFCSWKKRIPRFTFPHDHIGHVTCESSSTRGITLFSLPITSILLIQRCLTIAVPHKMTSWFYEISSTAHLTSTLFLICWTRGQDFKVRDEKLSREVVGHGA